MKQVTKLMIDEFNIEKLGYDFMGYKLQKGDIYTFHHLIVPNREGGPYARWNGAILCGQSSHPYLHCIENYSYSMFSFLTSEMLDMNIKGYLATSNLRQIDEVLREFEDKYGDARTRKGKPLIKSIYRERQKF